MSCAEALVSVRNVNKRFGATVALDDVSVDFRAGEVHALVGENGAGKSTLGNIVLGVHAPDSGHITLDGSRLQLSGPADAAAAGLVGVAQELSLLPAMSVVDNVVLGSEEGIGPFVGNRANRERVKSLIDRYGLDVPLDAKVGSLSVAERQKVEILRALGRQARLIVFDEPTARLASHEANELRRTVRELAESGAAVVYVSHFLDEVLSVAETITIMRDGGIVRTGASHDETHDSLVEAMTGRSLDELFPPKAPKPDDDAPIVLRVSSLSRKNEFSDVSLTIRAGEIVGLGGLVGAGRSEVAHTIYGASHADSGLVEINGSLVVGSVQSGLASGISLIPESRRDQGLIARRSVKDNTTLPYLRKFAGWAGVRVRQEHIAASKVCEDAGVKTTSVNVPVSSLSGGNQQKVLFARAMLGDPTLFIADEPTRGVDVGAKRSIYEVVNKLAESGRAVLLISSELEEIVGLSHRVLVMRQGRVVAEYTDGDINESNILTAAFGQSSDIDAASSPHRSSQ